MFVQRRRVVVSLRRCKRIRKYYILVPLIRILLLMAVVALLFTARYPKGMYDFVIPDSDLPSVT